MARREYGFVNSRAAIPLEKILKPKARLLDAMRDPDVRKVMSDLMHERPSRSQERKKLAEAVSAARSRPVTINGTIYRSVTAAAKALESALGNPLSLIKQDAGYSYS